MRHILMLLALLLACPAWGADWLAFCRTGDTTSGVGGGQNQVSWACANPTSATDDTAVLTTACENFDVLIYDDADGDGTASATLTYSLQHCPAASFASDSIEDAACVEFSSGGTHTGTGETLGVAARFFKVAMGGTFTSSSDPRIIVSCVGGQGSR